MYVSSHTTNRVWNDALPGRSVVHIAVGRLCALAKEPERCAGSRWIVLASGETTLLNKLDSGVHVLRPAPCGEEKKRAIVPVAVLMPADSPRKNGLDPEHVARLAETTSPLPPILVRRSDMRVVDGMHRLSVAMIRGQATIEVEYFDGSAEDAFLHAVEANVVHGLPLSRTDRRAAAYRIMSAHPQLSDRAIARVSGLGDKAVASLRRRTRDSLPEVTARLGRDGRFRPVSSVEGRLRAAAVIASNPRASLRQVARIAGISPGTVSDVRRRLERGQPPAPEPVSHARDDTDSTARPCPGDPDTLPLVMAAPEPAAGWRDGQQLPDPATMLKKLLRDPSLRLNEEGRSLLRVLQQNTAAARVDFVAAVPSHCGELVSYLARHYARTWLKLAEGLEQRIATQDGGAEQDAEIAHDFPAEPLISTS